MADRRLEWTGLLLVVVAGAGVWLARHPDAPALVAASRWPVVGTFVGRFRVAFRPPRRAPEGRPQPAEEPRRIAALPAPPAPPQGPVVVGPEVAGAATAAPSAAASTAPVDRSPVPPGPLPARAADPARRDRIAALLGAGAHTGGLGPYRYLGDLEPPPRWARIAVALDDAYALRTGLRPLGRPAETVVVVSDPDRYAALRRLEPRLAGIHSGGHAVAGLAVIEADPDSPQLAEATFVHELVHLLDRRAIGPALPPWLDEGLAEDLAWTPFDAQSGSFRWGELRGSARRVAIPERRAGAPPEPPVAAEAATLRWAAPGGRARREGAEVELTGALAGTEAVVAAHAAGTLPTLDELVAMDWPDFVSADAPLHYAQSMWFVRFLLDGGDADRARGFRAYLAAVAAGGAVDGEALESSLGRSLAGLEPGFRAFVAIQKATRVDPLVAGLAPSGERVAP